MRPNRLGTIPPLAICALLSLASVSCRSGDSQQAADQGQHSALGEKQPCDPPGGKSQRPQRADLAQSLLDAESEEQPREHQS